MVKEYSIYAFFAWVLVPPVVTAYLVHSGSGYILVYGGMLAAAVIVLAALVVGWLTKTLAISLFGMMLGFVLAAFWVNAVLLAP